MRERRRIGAVLTAAVLVLAACSGDDGGDGGGSGPPQSSEPGRPPASRDDGSDMPSIDAAEPVGTLEVAGRPLGVKYAIVAADRAYGPYLERLRGTPTFHEAVWCDVEREQGRRDWSELDRAADIAERYGIELALKIRVGSCWATDGVIGTPRGQRQKTASAPPVDPAAYDAWITELVQRYAPRGVRRWAIENEVNTDFFWVGSAEEYGQLVERAAEVVRRVEPDAIVLDSGLSSMTLGVGVVNDLLAQGRDDEALAAYDAYFERRHTTRRRDYPEVSSVEELRDVAASDRWTTSQSFVDEAFRLAHDGVIDALQVHFYETWWSVPALTAFLRERLPAGMPFEVWEAGLFWPDAPDDPQLIGAETMKTVSLLFAGGSSVVMWLPLGADPAGQGNEEQRFGLLDPDGSARPVADLFAVLAAGLEDATVEPIRYDGLSGMVAFDRTGATAVVWADEGTASLPVTLPARAEILATDGTEANGGGLAPEIGTQPVLLELPAATPADLTALLGG